MGRYSRGRPNEARAGSASYVLRRLPTEVKILFREWLAEHSITRIAPRHVMFDINQKRGGKDYEAQFGQRI